VVRVQGWWWGLVVASSKSKKSSPSLEGSNNHNNNTYEITLADRFFYVRFRTADTVLGRNTRTLLERESHHALFPTRTGS